MNDLIHAGQKKHFFHLGVHIFNGHLASPLGKRALQSPLVRREWPFNLQARQDLLIQGVLDLCFLEEDEWVLVDYKTDAVSQMQTLKDRYREQLGWYQKALEKLTGRKVREALLYSVRLGKTIRV